MKRSARRRPSTASERPAARARRDDLPETVAPRKADRVARDLLSRIASGELAVGSVLPKEDALAKSYGVNRGVVREAVKLLEVHRLVRPVRRRGTVVLDPLGSMSAEVLVALLAPRTGHIDRHVLAGFLEVRAVLDAQMAELAAERRAQADVRAMRGCLAELEESLAEPARYGALVDRMARLVARATKNPLYEMFAAYNAHVARELGTALLVIRPPSREHLDAMRILVDVIDQKESAAARRLVTEFHAWGTPRILAAASLASGESLRRIAKEMER